LTGPTGGYGKVPAGNERCFRIEVALRGRARGENQEGTRSR